MELDLHPVSHPETFEAVIPDHLDQAGLNWDVQRSETFRCHFSSFAINDGILVHSNRRRFTGLGELLRLIKSGIRKVDMSMIGNQRGSPARPRSSRSSKLAVCLSLVIL